MTKRLAFWFAYTGYSLTFTYYFGPSGVAGSTTLHRILPFWMCILTGHRMPVSAVALFIAPINAAIFGAVGATVGLVVSGLFSKLRSRTKAKTTPSATY
jgi:hypothetical protein